MILAPLIESMSLKREYSPQGTRNIAVPPENGNLRRDRQLSILLLARQRSYQTLCRYIGGVGQMLWRRHIPVQLSLGEYR